jgi:hypothetical protein
LLGRAVLALPQAIPVAQEVDLPDSAASLQLPETLGPLLELLKQVARWVLEHL